MFKKQKSQSYLILPENKEKAVVLKLFYDTNIILIPNLTRTSMKRKGTGQLHSEHKSKKSKQMISKWNQQCIKE